MALKTPNYRMQRRPRSEFRMIQSVRLAAPLMRSVRRQKRSCYTANELIGHTGKERIFAFIIDNLLATILAFMFVALIQSKQSILSGLIICGVYLVVRHVEFDG
jgi:hypothetical protein